MTRKTFVISTLLCFASFAFADARGEAIAQKHFDLKKSNDTAAIATMVLIDKSGTKKTRKLEIYTKEGSEGKNSFVKFLEPADIANTKFLTLSHQAGASEQRLFLPALKKARKIASSNKNGEFVNSDFYYYDMENRGFADNDYEFLSENEILTDKAFTGMKFFKIVFKPHEKQAPYSKSIAWINMENYAIYKLDCYDAKDDSLLKTITFPKMEIRDGMIIPTQTLVVNYKKSSKTLLALADLKVNQGLKDLIFSIQNLEQ